MNWNDRENPYAGGAEVHLHEIFGRLVRWGHQVDLVASGWAGAAPRAELDGIRVYRTARRYSFALRGRAAVRRRLRADAYDVLVEDLNKIPLYLAGLTTLPLSVLVHHLFGATIFREALPPVAALVWLAERPLPWAYRRAAFQAVSASTRDDLIARGVRAERIEVIPEGVDTAWYQPDSGIPRHPRPTFLYLGRLKRYKGVEIALRALADARQRRPELALDIVGQGDDRPRLERLTRELGQEAAVRFLGFVGEEEKRRLLRQAWAVVFPSPKEGWGISNVEAAACGTAALASDSPGLRESVRHGETGFLVPYGDWRALAERMLALAGDPGLVVRLGRGARAFAEGLSWERAARTTEAHLQRVIAEGG